MQQLLISRMGQCTEIELFCERKIKFQVSPECNLAIRHKYACGSKDIAPY
jgi:hypothetical protein